MGNQKDVVSLAALTAGSLNFQISTEAFISMDFFMYFNIFIVKAAGMSSGAWRGDVACCRLVENVRHAGVCGRGMLTGKERTITHHLTDDKICLSFAGRSRSI